ncbi:MAG: hypothetical protein OXU73_00405 [Candidatus Campbellbacteria bacterium]|nr:hypothetical protein [Candidatus Campbellbacteria bacterium]
MKNIKKIYLSIWLLIIFLLATPTVAQNRIIVNLRGGNEIVDSGGDARQFVGDLYEFLIIVGGILAVIMFSFGAFIYIFSEAIPKKVDGKEYMVYSILGVVVILSSYLIFQTIWGTNVLKEIGI